MTFSHGQSKTKEYRTLHGMIGRCHCPTNKKFHAYGARGIVVCDRWRFGDDFKTGIECFIEDMGRRPGPGFSIDRIDVHGNYEPGNCRWATGTEQQRNRRDNKILNVDGRLLSLAEAAERYGLRYGLVKRRLQNGWSARQSLGIDFRETQPGGRKLQSRNNLRKATT